jgi:hypothetical protein
LLRFIETNYPSQHAQMIKTSSLYASYNKCWPDCEKELAADVARALEAQRAQTI